MLSGEELLALLAAIWNNWFSLLSGVFGVILSVYSIYVPDRQKTLFKLLAIFAFVLSPVYAWRDEYRSHRKETAEVQQKLTSMEAELQKQQRETLQLADQKAYQNISLKPNIRLSYYYSDTGAGWRMFSYGPGYARFQWFAVYIDGSLKADWSEVADALGITGKMNFLVPQANSIVPPRVENSIFWVSSEAGAGTLKRNLHRVSFELCYCSLGNTCWLTNFKDAEKENSCNVKPKIVFKEPTIAK